MDTLGIYIHVPFCVKKCSYCDFYSVSYEKDISEKYIDAVIRNLRYYSDKKRITDTVYFGGGTPSLLSPEQITRILCEINNNFNLAENSEITLETNPNTVDFEKLSELRKTGINRLSVGVQSMIDRELVFLGRIHSAERAEKTVYEAYKAGFENISCDLMIALPEQSGDSLRYSVEKISALPVNHVSAYILKTEQGTPFDCDEIKNRLPDDDTVAGLYLEMVQIIESMGFEQYEVSNFAKKGFESRHNCRYWKCSDYIGIGPSAHSCNNGKRFAVGRSLADFIGSDVQNVFITDENPCGFEEYSMLRLRLKEGLDLDSVTAHRDMIIKKIPELIKSGYINYDGKFISLTPEGFLMSNSVISYLIF
ncbi:MAG: radical SAM family heme chaperone HemW [Ruminococcus sp.]|nr:radical SAM family heme chaperone HemW [Ruminococcus sp.]